MNWYKKAKKWKDKIPGGRADGKMPSDYKPSQVEKGKIIEYEHTNDPATAREISMDHLEEHPDYYHEDKGLPAMERGLGDNGKLEEKKPARRGRYPGQDENVPRDMMGTIIDDNELVEGEHVKTLHRMAVEGQWDSFNGYIEKLKGAGHSPTRINSMMTRSMHGVKL